MAIDFEKIQNEIKEISMNFCTGCGGVCENTEIVAFLPGEIDFAADKLKIDKQEFIKKYCNVIQYKNNDIYILKAGICPFLNDQKKCELEEFTCKLICCALYPTIIKLSGKDIEIKIDSIGCPMSHNVDEEFKNKTFKIFENIKDEIPLWWLEFCQEYDEAKYDYEKLEKLRDKQFIELDELKDCIIDKY
ncbi:MAG: hypothetical protein PHW52_04235 [Candidatus Pacebacteria bacterium]|nr:hypothetical protein [Candidatus Paceibacterota bacterium]